MEKNRKLISNIYTPDEIRDGMYDLIKNEAGFTIEEALKVSGISSARTLDKAIPSGKLELTGMHTIAKILRTCGFEVNFLIQVKRRSKKISRAEVRKNGSKLKQKIRSRKARKDTIKKRTENE